MFRSLEPHDFGRTKSTAPEVTELLEMEGERKPRDVISLGW
jgi:hypothetical protein